LVGGTAVIEAAIKSAKANLELEKGILEDLTASVPTEFLANLLVKGFIEALDYLARVSVPRILRSLKRIGWFKYQLDFWSWQRHLWDVAGGLTFQATSL
jgi:hypothetical protein